MNAVDRIAGRLHDMADQAADMLAAEPERLRALRVFTDCYGLDAYTPPEAVVSDVIQCVEFMVRLADRRALAASQQQVGE
jgi:hypothetical protein